MGRKYAVSDLHSTYTKFLSSCPKSFDKMIILGDIFNKGREQEEMLLWFMKNYSNPKYVFLFGNHEIRFFNELYRSLKTTNIDYDGLYDAWYESNNEFNITNVAYRLIQEGKLDADELFKKALKYFKWYHIEKCDNYTYILSHASWEIDKKPKNQNKKNLVYDIVKIYNAVRQKVNPKYDRYAQKCISNNIKHVFGHFVCPKAFKTQAPYINRDVFYFIDNGVFKKTNPYYFMELV